MELFDNIKEIKEQLFDAPVEVKKAFNDVVKYFSKDSQKVRIKSDSDIEKFLSELSPEVLVSVYKGNIKHYIPRGEYVFNDEYELVKGPGTIPTKESDYSKLLDKAYERIQKIIDKTSKFKAIIDKHNSELAKLEAETKAKREAKRKAEKERIKRWESRGEVYSPFDSEVTSKIVSLGVPEDIAKAVNKVENESYRSQPKIDAKDLELATKGVEKLSKELQDIIEQYKYEKAKSFNEANKNALSY